MRWHDDIKEVAGQNWMLTAQDRTKWKEMKDAYSKLVLKMMMSLVVRENYRSVVIYLSRLSVLLHFCKPLTVEIGCRQILFTSPS